MKKTILSVAIAMIAGLGFSAAAANVRQDDNTKARTEQSAVKKEKKEKQERGKRGGDIVVSEAFEGIELTDAQKSAIEKLREERLAEVKAAGEKLKADKEKLREDSKVRLKERREQFKLEQREGLNKMKQILTPEQYTVYLENIVISKPEGVRHEARHAHINKDRKNRDGAAKSDKRERGDKRVKNDANKAKAETNAKTAN